jgi:hypothetical protein
MLLKSLLPTLFLLLVSTAEAASTLRCGNRLISLDDPASEVEDKCGTPVQRDFLGYREILDVYGFVHEVEVEEWTYGPKNGMYYFLRLEGSRVTKIESKRGK